MSVYKCQVTRINLKRNSTISSGKKLQSDVGSDGLDMEPASREESVTPSPYNGKFNSNFLQIIPPIYFDDNFPTRNADIRKSKWVVLLRDVSVVILVAVLGLILFRGDFLGFKNENKMNELRSSLTSIDNLNKKICGLNQKLQGLNSDLNRIMRLRNTLVAEGDYKRIAKEVEIKIQEALTLYDADKTGLTDYALESAGGAVVSIPDTKPYPLHSYDILGFISFESSNPQAVIQPGVLPGQCFAFHGHRGKIRIKLAQEINVTAVSMEHTYSSLASVTSSAPKEFRVYGLRGDGDEKYVLGSFTYQGSQKALQIFKISNKAEMRYGFVEVDILSNHGNPNCTCVYRFRVHGE